MNYINKCPEENCDNDKQVTYDRCRACMQKIVGPEIDKLYDQFKIKPLPDGWHGASGRKKRTEC